MNAAAALLWPLASPATAVIYFCFYTMQRTTFFLCQPEKIIMKILSILSVFLLLLASCTTEKEDLEYVTYSYDQTSCADKWGTNSNDSITRQNVIKYLDSLKLYVADVKIKQESAGMTCLACQCLTGRVIYVTTLEAMRDRYLELGFK